MKAALVVRTLALLTLLVCAGAPRTARAREGYDPFKGYGTHSARLGLTAGFLSGTLPPGAGNAVYSQNAFNAEFNALLFAEPTVFGTLLGIEFDAALGLRTVDKPASVPDPEATAEGINPVFKMDFEFTYDLIRWKLLALRQRIILNAGGGFDYNTLPWPLIDGSSGWRAYPLLGGHVQSALGESLVLDVSYRFIPTQSKDHLGVEHRVQVAVGYKHVVVGAHFFTLPVQGDAAGPLVAGPLAQTQLGGFASWAF